jgi:hypothetical protein
MRIELRKRINGDLMITDLNLNIIYVLFHILYNILIFYYTVQQMLVLSQKATQEEMVKEL